MEVARDSNNSGNEEPYDRVEEINADSQIQPTSFKRGPGRPRLLNGERGQPRKLYNMIKHEANLVCCETNDLTVEKAMKGPLAKQWKEAMQLEFDALKRNNAWILVERPRSKNVVGYRWVLKTKYNADGSVERKKARLVAKGYTQRPGVDFRETFAPVARQSSVRILAALAAELGLTLYQLDVVMAYINGDLDEVIFMEQPEEFIEKGKEDQVCLLKKSIYELKQSERQWFKKLDQALQSFGLTPLETEKCFYVMKNQGCHFIVVIYVDDLIVDSNDEETYLRLKRDLAHKFQMKDLGLLRYCLGIEFNQNKSSKSTTMCQRLYIQSILAEYGMDEVKATTIHWTATLN